MENTKRLRIDKLLVELDHFPSREQAQRAILAGEVLVNETVVDKVGTLIRSDALVRVTARQKYVGRGGLKLEAALDHFEIEVTGLKCLDVGASTGGFTDCLLQRGAASVIALDVGHNQLAWKIRSDPRVEVHEGFNARHLSPEALGGKLQLAVVDVSFISLTLVLEHILCCLEPGASLVALIKPQFELKADQVGKGGIVRDKSLHQNAVERIHQFVTQQLNREWIGVIDSPITGAKGNREFLACLR
jgi:23S rRNA (cytidine1920-2'-O)/16S rRNA (cytidine1409-2'-O)-methyltransferase